MADLLLNVAVQSLRLTKALAQRSYSMLADVLTEGVTTSGSVRAGVIWIYTVARTFVAAIYYLTVYPILGVVSLIAHAVPWVLRILGWGFGAGWLIGYCGFSFFIVGIATDFESITWGIMWMIPFNILAWVVFAMLFFVRQALVLIGEALGPVGVIILIFVIGFGDDMLDGGADGGFDVGFPDFGIGSGTSSLGVPMVGDFLPSVSDFTRMLPEGMETPPLESVSGYVRADGIEVDSYVRTVADGDPANNLGS